MLQRLLAVILICAVPTQGFAVPHVHGASEDGSGDDHRKPHIHIGTGYGHDHRIAPDRPDRAYQQRDFRQRAHRHPHQADTACVSSAGDREHQRPVPVDTHSHDGADSHDDDAVYVSGFCFDAQAKAKLPLPHGPTAAVEVLYSAARGPLLTLPAREKKPPNAGGLPSFLKMISLQI